MKTDYEMRAFNAGRQTIINIDEQVKKNKNSIKEIKQVINSLNDQIKGLKVRANHKVEWCGLDKIKAVEEALNEEEFTRIYYYEYIQAVKYDEDVKRIFDLIKDGKTHKIEQELKELVDNLKHENKRYRRLLSVKVELLLNSLFRALKGYFTGRK